MSYSKHRNTQHEGNMELRSNPIHIDCIITHEGMKVIRTFLIEEKGGMSLQCDVTSDDIWFTVYQNDIPVATVSRPHVRQSDWQLHYTNGALIASSTIGPRSLFRSLVSYLNAKK